MILGLCGFADLVRRHGGDVGSVEMIDAVRGLALIDLADRRAVKRALTLTISWADVQPDLFDQLFDEWFSGHDLRLPASGSAGLDEGSEDTPDVALDAETTEAARIHADDALTVDDGDRSGADGATGDERSSAAGPTPGTPSHDDGVSVAAPGDLADRPPGDDIGDDDGVRQGLAVVELPDAPVDAELELARRELDAALARRQQAVTVRAPRPVTALSQPLSASERVELTRHVRRLERHLDGAPSWRRARAHHGTVDMRRTMRRLVTTAGLPVDLRHTGRRHSAANLVVLVDLSLSVRGTARLVLHLVHRLRSTLGSVRSFGFVDVCVPIDRALRVADPAVAIERVLGSVDVDASSDPGRALRQWWARSHQLVTPESHVLILGDGRCNGRDPAFDTVSRLTQRSASTLWVSPEPEGAWTLGRGEMADYATRVDRAVTVRSMADLDRLVPTVRMGRTEPVRPTRRG